MKLLLVLPLLFSSISFADMDKDLMGSLEKEGSKFKKDCLDSVKATEVKEMPIMNKTAESFDKKELSESLFKDLNLTINPKSNRVLTVTVASTSVEKNKVKTSQYTLAMDLKDAGKDVCNKQYLKVITVNR